MFDGIKTFEMISSIPVDAYSPQKNKGGCIRVYVCTVFVKQEKLQTLRKKHRPSIMRAPHET